MSPIRILICEARGHWAVFLRRLAGNDVKVTETRNLAECRSRFQTQGAHLLIVEARRDHLWSVTSWVVRHRRESPTPVIAVLEDGLDSAWGWLLREAGVAHIVQSPRQLGPVVHMARRAERIASRNRSSAAHDGPVPAPPWLNVLES